MRASIRSALVAVALTSAVMGVVSVPVASPASAAVACNAPRCYWLASWSVSPPSGFDGSAVNVRANCLLVGQADPSYFVTNELWTLDPNGNWIETGIVQGHPAGRPTGSGTVFLWGDKRPGSGFYGHYSTTQVPFGQYHRMAVRTAGTATWNVRSGPITGVSTSSLLSMTRMDTGMEAYQSSSANVIAESSSSSMSWYNLSGTEIDGWRSGLSGGAVLYPYPGDGYRRWVQQYYWMQYGVNSCSALAAATAEPAATVRSLADPATRRELAELAWAVARQSGDAAAVVSGATPATRSEALKVVTPGNTVSEDGPSYVLELRGRFTLNSAPRPRGTAVPQGTVLGLVVDAKALTVTDIALTDRPAALSTLGRSVPLG
jgi:hypothetical protein